MRFIVMIVMLGLVTAPAQAQTTGTAQSGSNNYGRIYCSPHVPCPGDLQASPADLASNAQSCITSYFGVRTSMFNATAGLDSNACLASNGAAYGDGSLTPQCCVVEVAPHDCTFRCELNKI